MKFIVLFWKGQGAKNLHFFKKIIRLNLHTSQNTNIWTLHDITELDISKVYS